MSNTAIKDWEKSGQKHGAISVRMVTVLSVVLLMLTFSAALPIGSGAQPGDPLPSWNDGVIVRLPQLETFNDRDSKPVNIDRNIGMHPIFVAGNVGNEGDIAMIQYSKGRAGASFQLLFNHDDGEREFLYGEPGNNSLNAAKTCRFTVVNVKSDWKTVPAFQKTGN